MNEMIPITNESRLIELETTIERGQQTFIEVGLALAEIRDSELYKQNFTTFEGYCKDRWGWERRHAYRLMEAANTVNEMCPMGHKLPTIQTERQARELAKIKDPEIRLQVWNQVNEYAAEIETTVTAKLVKNAVEGRFLSIVEQKGLLDNFVKKVIPSAHVSNNSGNHEWYTPGEYVRAAAVVMGGIDLDPASSAKANETVGARTFFDISDNGLSKEWTGTVWLNPPYEHPLIGQFCKKLTESLGPDGVTEAILLVNNATETVWFRTVARVASAICFPAGRIRFLDFNGEPKLTPLQGQAILYCGEGLEAFFTEFRHFGIVLRK